MVTLLDAKMRIPAGQPVVWNGYPYTDEDYTATVVMPGPVASSVWALDSAGGWLCLKWHGKRQMWVNITRAHATALADQRAVVVDAMVEMELRLRGRKYQWTPGPEHRESVSDWIQARLDHDLQVLAQLRARFWGELYGVTRTD